MASTACARGCAGGLRESLLARPTRFHISCLQSGAIRCSSPIGSLPAIRRRRRQHWAAAAAAVGGRTSNKSSCRRSGVVRHPSRTPSSRLSTASVNGGGATEQWSRSLSARFLPPLPPAPLRDTCVTTSGRRRTALVTDVRRPSPRVCAANNVPAAAAADVAFVTPEEARALVIEEGYTVIDVRDNTQFERSHLRDSVHVPLFVENRDMDPATIVKRQMHSMMTGSLYGTAFTKPNDRFLPTLEARFPKTSKLLVVCQEGLRSAKAAEDLVDAGYQQVSCLTSGLQAVKPGLFEKEGERELQDAGKAGIAAIQGKISIVLGTVLITLYLLLKLFPDQAEELFNRFAP
ncbi:hypothetical protein CBR_g12715 [Chara braunii]|uniref:Rhodanese domain-containing protein n=1 Tax=Chara braunii TaxID=69332 RepID=A0A388KSH7_CHABU|nr:hypothetical protein CBR_g12715 [Chara braunii]|eukprot:GBG72996.1 hypothetical protein CBR_g12715 [Chara braunii]